MKLEDYMTPFFKFILLCNGIEIAHASNSLTAQGAYNVFNLMPVGNGRYRSAATNIALRFHDTQYMGNNRLLTKVSVDVDGYPLGYPSPLVLDVSDEWPPGVPIAVLHWLKDNRVYKVDGSDTDEYERFSLIVVKAE